MKRITKAEREAVYAMFYGRCAYCAQPLGKRWHADHVEPVIRMDWTRRLGYAPRPPDHPERHRVDNLMPACAPCNIDKHTLSIEEWRKKLQDACGVLARNQPTYRHAVRFGLVKETGARIEFHFERLARGGADA